MRLKNYWRACLVRREKGIFEVVIVEGRSQIPCKEVCDKYADKLDLHYYSKEIRVLGRAVTMVLSVQKVSICSFLTPMLYFRRAIIRAVSEELEREPADAFGGPDCAHDSLPTHRRPSLIQ